MKLIDVALKDLKRVLRSPFSLVMMFGAPFLIAGLLYLAFGNLTRGTGSFTLPRTQVVVVNLDHPGASSGFKAGETLISFLQSEDLADVLAVTVAPDEATARTAVDSQQADVALIIPANFSQAATTPGHKAAVAFYQDPTLSIGPGIVKDLVNHYMDGFSGASIAADVAIRSVPGGQRDPTLAETVMRSYAAFLQGSDHGAALHVISPTGNAKQPNAGASLIGPIMAGMTILFVFFMGGNGAQSIIKEHEEGTLARLFTTPTSQLGILGGKFLAVFCTLAIQTVVLVVASALLFRIDWGQPLSVIASAFGMIVCATGFGVMVMSLVKETRQTGPVLGGVLTLTSMLGGLMSNGLANIPPVMDTISLSMPQGWAMQAMKLCLAGKSLGAVLVPTLVMIVLGLVFFLIGLSLFRRRFA